MYKNRSLCLSLLLCAIASNSKAAESEYTALTQKGHAITYATHQIVHFGAKGDPELTGADAINFNDNQSVFWGFCAQDKRMADYLTATLPTHVKELPLSTNLSQELECLLNDTVDSFYKEHPDVDSRETQTQKITINFTHLINTRAYVYQLQWTETGEYKLLARPFYMQLNPVRTKNNHFISLPCSAQFESSTFNSVLKNKRTRHDKLKKPVELVEQIASDDTNPNLMALLLIQGNQWLKQCKCPETTESYKSLKRKWDACNKESAMVADNDIEATILKQRYASAKELKKFAKQLRAEHKYDANATLETNAPFAFLDDMIAQKQAEEDASLITHVKNLATGLLSCCVSR